LIYNSQEKLLKKCFPWYLTVTVDISFNTRLRGCVARMWTAVSCPRYGLMSSYRTQPISVAAVVQLPMQLEQYVSLAEITIADIHQLFMDGNLTCSNLITIYMQASYCQGVFIIA